MAISKVIYNGNTLIDLTDSTIVPDKIIEGYIGYAKDGTKIIGTHKPYIEICNNYKPNGESFQYQIYPHIKDGGFVEISISDWINDTNVPNLISIGSNIEHWGIVAGKTNYYFHIYGRQTSLEIDGANGTSISRDPNAWTYDNSNETIIRLDSSGLSVNGTIITDLSSQAELISSLDNMLIGSIEGNNRSSATYNYIHFE